MLRLRRKPKHLMPEWVRDQMDEAASQPSLLMEWKANDIGNAARGQLVQYASATDSSTVHVLPSTRYNTSDVKELRRWHRAQFQETARRNGADIPSARDAAHWWPGT